jgi:hypothetical protein
METETLKDTQFSRYVRVDRHSTVIGGNLSLIPKRLHRILPGRAPGRE